MVGPPMDFAQACRADPSLPALLETFARSRTRSLPDAGIAADTIRLELEAEFIAGGWESDVEGWKFHIHRRVRQKASQHFARTSQRPDTTSGDGMLDQCSIDPHANEQSWITMAEELVKDSTLSQFDRLTLEATLRLVPMMMQRIEDGSPLSRAEIDDALGGELGVSGRAARTRRESLRRVLGERLGLRPLRDPTA